VGKSRRQRIAKDKSLYACRLLSGIWLEGRGTARSVDAISLAIVTPCAPVGPSALSGVEAKGPSNNGRSDTVARARSGNGTAEAEVGHHHSILKSGRDVRRASTRQKAGTLSAWTWLTL
jgi:hypothetical protein